MLRSSLNSSSKCGPLGIDASERQNNTYLIDRFPVPIGAFQGQWNTMKWRNRIITTTTVKNPNWPEANQLAFYKCSWEVEPGTNSTSGQSGSWTRDIRISRQTPNHLATLPLVVYEATKTKTGLYKSKGILSSAVACRCRNHKSLCQNTQYFFFRFYLTEL